MLTLLLGHVSPETAHVTEDYPYGRRLRCKKRVWIEKATKGAKKGEERVVSQTTNPKITTAEVWNKPHPGQYCDYQFLYLDSRTGYVRHTGLHVNGPRYLAVFIATGLFAQLPQDRKDLIARHVEFDKTKFNKWSWIRYNNVQHRLRVILADAGTNWPTAEELYENSAHGFNGPVPAMSGDTGEGGVYVSDVRDAYNALKFEILRVPTLPELPKDGEE